MKYRGFAVAFSSLFLLSACANTNAQDANLSPAEQVLRHSGSNTWLTTTEGAVVGAAALCGLGALVAGVKGCIAGSVAGGIAGGAGGYYVASRAQVAKQTEDQYASTIEAANKDAATAQQLADASQTVANEATQNINNLRVQLRNQQITVAQYNQSIAQYKKDKEILVSNVTETQKRINGVNQLISLHRGTAAQQQELVKARQKLQLALRQQEANVQSLNSVGGVS